MKKNRFLGALLAFGPLMTAQRGTDARVTIRLVNSAKVARRTLAQAEEQASYVLEKAGIEVIWRDCTAATAGPCTEELRTGDFWLHVADWKPAGISAELLGFTGRDATPGGAMVAGVYHPMVVQVATSFAMQEAPILGAALSHEIGHLLGAGHSATGVMRRHFNRQCMVEFSQGGFLFSKDQAVRMRASAMERNPGLELSGNGSVRHRQ